MQKWAHINKKPPTFKNVLVYQGIYRRLIILESLIENDDTIWPSKPTYYQQKYSK